MPEMESIALLASPWCMDYMMQQLSSDHSQQAGLCKYYSTKMDTRTRIDTTTSIPSAQQMMIHAWVDCHHNGSGSATIERPTIRIIPTDSEILPLVKWLILIQGCRRKHYNRAVSISQHLLCCRDWSVLFFWSFSVDYFC